MVFLDTNSVAKKCNQILKEEHLAKKAAGSEEPQPDAQELLRCITKFQYEALRRLVGEGILGVICVHTIY